MRARSRFGRIVVPVIAAALLIGAGPFPVGAETPPVGVWAARWGSTGDEQGLGIAVDGSGNVYTTGWFEGTVDFDPGPGTANLTASGSEDVFVSKLDSSGNLVWARRWGSTGGDQGLGIAVDGSGNVYTTGWFEGTVDFDPRAGTSNLTSAGQDDVFVSKLDSSGRLVWAHRWGSTGNDQGSGVAVDGSGNVHTTGWFDGTVDFDPEGGTANLTSAGQDDVFVSKLDSSGSYLWARRWGSFGDDRGYGIALDGSGNVHTTGYFRQTVDFDPGGGTANLTSNGGDDVFVSKLSVSGNYLWAEHWGNPSGDRGYGIAVDGSGNVHTTGRFYATVDFDPGPGTANLTSNGDFDVFVSKLDSSGDYLWARHWGASKDDIGYGIAVDGSSNVHTVGFFQETVDFDPGPGTANLASAAGYDVFVSRLDASGDYAWARRWGSVVSDAGWAIAVDGSGNVYTTGYFWRTVDFDPGAGVIELTSAGGRDVFVSKLAPPSCNGLPVTWDMNTQGAFTGTPGDDVVLGTDGPDVIDTGYGNDTVCGRAGDDTITTRAGIDWVDGGDGNDTIRLGARNDTAYGGNGHDVINGGGGVDHIEGGAHDDVIWDSFGADVTVRGNAGDDLFVIGRGEANQVAGGSGTDRVDFRSMPAGVIIDLSDQTSERDGLFDIFSSIEEARGSKHDDHISGSGGPDKLIGYLGNDTILGQGGDDDLIGDNGDDTLNGGSGWDRLVGGASDGDYCLEGENIHPSCEFTAL